jgi:hypothetical protein
MELIPVCKKEDTCVNSLKLLGFSSLRLGYG